MRNENVKKIIMGADRYGFDLKNAIKEHLLKQGYDVVDVNPDAPILFQDAACKVSQGIQSGEFDRGIALCGTGMGVSIICNKHKGVYAALCESVYQARRAKQVNNTNVLCMGGFLIGHEMGRVMTDAWLEQNHMEGLDPEMAKIVGKEFDELVEFEKQEH
ncbi:RpiB/LacA/LacB family sugar-phosphate isomerase [Faecalicatena contorta]|uniref:RpiB/LacA/LacB family sugar-phosphate isomerase n=1 Tax=Faecalicatena contorta TaxID=39482 RepID=UPI001F28DBDF|nr:RpiB/LacA/LacB family sugar-phosphate isomerase [Faecalicatena contorta]